MTVVHSPARKHACNVGWVSREAQPGELGYEPGEQRHILVDAGWRDAPGTVRQCDDCGRCWVAVRFPHVTSGSQRLGVYWRPETRRERRKREKGRAL